MPSRLRPLVRGLLPPVITDFIRSRRLTPHARAVARELERLRNATGPTQTNLTGWSFQVPEGREFANLYRGYFIGRLCDFQSNTTRPYIIDCGAHIGVSVAWWKARYPAARVLAFEPDPDNFQALSFNCGHLSDVTLVKAGVWRNDGNLTFAARGGENGRFAQISPRGGDRKISVRCVRLAPYLSEHVDLLKMDIEGAEIDVLADCADRLGNVDRLFMEHHSWHGQHQRLGQTMTILEEAGFRLYAYGGTMPRPFVELARHDLRLQVFAYKAHVAPVVRSL